MTDHSALLDYWFGELRNGFADEAHRARWFRGEKAFDAALRQKFGHLVAAADAGQLQTWLESPRGTIAYVLVCDQLPRNIYRGTRQAFATDRLALAASRSAVQAGTDLLLDLEERGFLYLPFEHSENLLDQHTGVGLLMQLRDDTPKDKRALIGSSLRHAQQHRDIIRRFGRFPHRNAVLNRIAGPEESEFMAQGHGFGQ